MEKRVLSMCVYMAKRTKDKLLQLYHLKLKELYCHFKLCLLAKLSNLYLNLIKDANFVKDLDGIQQQAPIIGKLYKHARILWRKSYNPIGLHKQKP